MIEIKELSFSYTPYGQKILRDISLTVPDGQIVGLLGANGAGKTTLLKCAAGLLQQNRTGEISFDGRPPEACGGEIAFLTEAGSCLRDLTPREFGAFLEAFFPRFDAAYYEKLLRFFALEEKPIKQMSKGQRAKAEVAAGMAKRTNYILMDEPFTGKDLFTRRDFMQALAGSLTGEETILLTTHEIGEIEHFIDRAVILRAGEIAADVSIDDLHESGKSLTELMRETAGYDPQGLAELLADADEIP